MFAVIFEVRPKPDQWDAYLGHAQRLRPELERIDGFIDNIRYRSLTRDGWLVSLSAWRDEKALIRWRTRPAHHAVQAQARAAVFADYHLRVGQITHDSWLPSGESLPEQRLDETETGAATAVLLINAACSADTGADAVAASLGLIPDAPGLVAWDVFHAVLSPGEALLLLSWRDASAAEAFEAAANLPEQARLRRVRVIRDYGMFDRREAPQYSPEVNRKAGSEDAVEIASLRSQ